MMEKVNGDDFPVWDSHKKKKKKYKRPDVEREDGGIQDAELSGASPRLFEDHAAWSSEVSKKKKKKKKNKGEEQQPLLDHSLAEPECEVGCETVMDASQKRKKKRKRKLNESPDGHSDDVGCVPVDQNCVDSCQESGADNECIKKSVKKKRKRMLAEEDVVSESPASETHSKTGRKRLKKKKKKRRASSSQDTQEDTDVSFDQSFPTHPDQKKRGEDMDSPSTTRKGGVAASQCGGSARGASAVTEDPMDAPTDFSRPPEEAKMSKRAKVVKSRTYITEDSSSDSDVMTPENTTSNRKEDQNNSVTETTEELSAEDEELLHTLTVLDLDTAKQELEEFIPHVGQLSDHSIRKMAGRDLLRFKQFKKQGVAIKFGRFTQKENNQIRKNVEDFLAITGIDSAEKLLFTSRYPEEKEAINRLKTEHLFCVKLAEGIPRAWRLIYYRARKMFDPNNYKGRYTKEEKEKLKKYHALHGNDWKKIAEMMSRSNLSVAMKYSEIKSPINYGPWSKEEIQKLMHAVEEVIVRRMKLENANFLSSSKKSHRNLQIDREKLFQKLPWTEIETKVGTRYWRQCKQKWTSVLTNKITKGQQLYRGTKGLQASINLIQRLYDMKVEDANEINWEELSDTIGDVPGCYVQAKFYKLKVSYVPFWRTKTFSEIIDHLFEKTLPELEQRLEKKKGKQENSNDSTGNPKKQVFQLSDVFDTSEESDD
ncbi:transcription termination factor 1 [Excalfactoria chinensis]|uniref:transcription termination factor 1 n=1 Tax=Excalfactoria chinensis TaxID=46218 RepID=UPI003B3B2182